MSGVSDWGRVIHGLMFFYPHRQKYVDPSNKEGFSEIVQVNFVPEFKDDEQEKLYHSHLLES